MNRKKSNPDQVSFLQTGPEIGSLAIENEIKGILSAMFRKVNLSRYQIAALISESVDYEVSKSMLDNYTGESKVDCRVPVAVLAGATVACKDYSAIRFLCESIGGGFVEPKELDYLDLVRLQKQIVKLQAKEAELKHKIGG